MQFRFLPDQLKLTFNSIFMHWQYLYGLLDVLVCYCDVDGAEQNQSY